MPTAVVQPVNLGPEFELGTTTPNKITIAAATTAVAGKVELATTAEATAGASTTLAVTPAGLAAAIAANPDSTPVATDTVQGKVALAVAANYPAQTTNDVDAATPAFVTASSTAAVAQAQANATVVLTDAFGVTLGNIYP